LKKERSGLAATGSVRCAIYTRKSTTEGLDSDFSSLDAQREACEHYIRSQAALGWTLVEERYDDGGFTGGNLERPGLTRLVDDIERGAVDSVVVYKVDRLSRSLIDFARLMERFEKKNVAFVSVTQAIDTTGSMGRLTMNMLLSFAQFERELISERTRDKIQAARRRGKWTGGRVVLGYAVDSEGRRLRIAPDEAKLVSLIFDLYLKTRSIGEVARRINALGHTQQRSAKGGLKVSAGRWTKNRVHRILRNPTYAGKVRAGDGTLHAGEHEPIVSLDVFERASKSLDDRTTGQTRRSRKSEYLLTGILRCGPCGAAMTSSASNGRGGQRYRYYRCCLEHPEGSACPTGLLNAGEIEQAVVAQVREIARRDDLKQAVLAQMETQEGYLADAEGARERLNDQMAALSVEAERLLLGFKDAGAGGKLLAGRLGQIENEMDQLRREILDLEGRLGASEDVRTRSERVAALLDGFDPIWEALVPEERRELLHLLVRQVVVDLDRGGLRITFHDLPGGAEPTRHEPMRAIA
jgi:site-specific DNA recombinase